MMVMRKHKCCNIKRIHFKNKNEKKHSVGPQLNRVWAKLLTFPKTQFAIVKIIYSIIYKIHYQFTFHFEFKSGNWFKSSNIAIHRIQNIACSDIIKVL